MDPPRTHTRAIADPERRASSSPPLHARPRSTTAVHHRRTHAPLRPARGDAKPRGYHAGPTSGRKRARGHWNTPTSGRGDSVVLRRPLSSRGTCAASVNAGSTQTRHQCAQTNSPPPAFQRPKSKSNRGATAGAMIGVPKSAIALVDECGAPIAGASASTPRTARGVTRNESRTVVPRPQSAKPPPSAPAAQRTHDVGPPTCRTARAHGQCRHRSPRAQSPVPTTTGWTAVTSATVLCPHPRSRPQRRRRRQHPPQPSTPSSTARTQGAPCARTRRS